MEETIKSIKAYESDRNWLEKLKRDYNFKSITAVISAIRKLIIKHKMQGELKNE